MRTEREYGYWIDRARKAGLTREEISTYSVRNADALPHEVRWREEMQRSVQREILENRISVEGNTLEFSIAFAVDTKEHHVEVRKLKLKNGNYLAIWAPPSIGQPTEFDLNILLACFKIGQRNNYLEYEASVYEIAKALGYKTPGKREFDLIRSGFRRLAASYIETNNWFNPKTKRRETISAFNFLQGFGFDKETKRYRIRFSEWIEDSIKAKYLKQIDMAKAQRLRGATKIIYLNLVKLVGKKNHFEISEELILRWLGRWEKYETKTRKRYNFYIKRHIDPSVAEAVGAMGFEVVKENSIYKLTRIWDHSESR